MFDFSPEFMNFMDYFTKIVVLPVGAVVLAVGITLLAAMVGTGNQNRS